MSTETAPQRPTAASRPELPVAIGRMLDRVRWREAGLQAAVGPLLVLAVLVLGWVIQAWVDRHLHLSLPVRRGLLGLETVTALVALYFLALRPLMRLRSRRQAAHLVEGLRPQFRSSLISAVELTSPQAAVETAPQSRALVAQMLEDVSVEVGRSDLAGELFRIDRVKRWGWVLLAALVLAGGLWLTQRPLSTLLVQRLFLSSVALPGDTTVVSLTGDLRLDPGMDARLSARAEGRVPTVGRLVVIYPGGQQDVVEVPASAEDGAVFTHTVKNVRGSFQYRFELNDGVGPEHRVTVVIPPALKEIRFTQIYPGYTGLPETRMAPSALRLLHGSRLRLDAVATLPLQSAVLEITGAESRPLAVTGEDRTALTVELPVPARGWTGLSLHLKSADGTPSVNDPVYRVEITTDQPPMVALLQPKKDRLSLLPRDKVPLAFRVTDDYGLKRLVLQYRIFRPGLSELSEATEKGSVEVEFPEGEKAFMHKLEWDLGRMVPPLTPGCRVTCWMEAEDNNTVTGPSVAKSLEKLIDIVTEEQKRMELLELLGERARAIEKLYDMQRATNEKTDQSIR